MLVCQVCGYSHPSMISPSHLKSHGISGPEYKSRFPGSVLRIQTEESKRKTSSSKKGSTAWNKGLKTGPNPKLSATVKGVARPNSKGKTRTEEQKARISERTKEAMKDAMTPEVRKKMSDAISVKKATGTYIPPMLGKKLTTASKNKIRSSLALTNDKKSADIISGFVEKAKAENIVVRSIEDNYWFNLTCSACQSNFSVSRQMFRPSTRDGKQICPTCFPRSRGRSKLEDELFSFVKSLSSSVEANNRTILHGKELDILVPDKKIAFEFTGLYWHAEKQNTENKHLLWKMQYARKEGITLYTIFEDEWVLKRPIVESRIRGLLGAHKCKIFARKCEVRKIDKNLKDKFLIDNHLQGKDSASNSLGLFHQDELVSVATFKKTNMVKGGDGKSWELSRFCSKLDHRIVGAASKLIEYFQRSINTEKLDLISYADRRWSQGNLYEQIGFKFSGTSSPSYWYTRDYKTRIHRSALMKHKLLKCENDKSKTEWELAKERGYDRIWDCGTTKWILYSTNQ